MCSIRIVPHYTIMGHTAGVAAWLAVRDQVQVQKVNIQEIQYTIIMARQII
jgi:hypothetical protein